MFMRRLVRGILVVLFASVCFYATIDAQEPHPTCVRCNATYIEKSEIDDYTTRSKTYNIPDQEMRNVDIGKVNAGIGVVTRPKLLPGMKIEGVAEHEQVTEVMYVLDGSGTTMTSPDLVNAKLRDPNRKTVREQNGPGFSAESMENAVPHHLKAGDVLIIPAGTGHQFTLIEDHITYLMVRIDPDKILAIKDAEKSRAYLQSSPQKPE
jgi:mannose-6-phosphate isomerase-like protein (cupin superfamily)